MAGGPLRIDSRPSRWSVTRETERGGGGREGVLGKKLERNRHPRSLSSLGKGRGLVYREYRARRRTRGGRGGGKKGGRKMEGGKEEAVAVGIS